MAISMQLTSVTVVCVTSDVQTARMASLKMMVPMLLSLMLLLGCSPGGTVAAKKWCSRGRIGPKACVKYRNGRVNQGYKCWLNGRGNAILCYKRQSPFEGKAFFSSWYRFTAPGGNLRRGPCNYALYLDTC